MNMGINVSRLRRDLCGSDILPLDFSGEWFGHTLFQRYTGTYLGEFNIRVIKTQPGRTDNRGKIRKSSKHRVHVQCNHCHEWYPAGRWHQHMKVHEKETV